jgi:hypothetical protein
VAHFEKQVILLARASERYVSVFDSTNADLDSGELKDAALAASKLLKTGAVVTSLYDSDSYEFVVFSNVVPIGSSGSGPISHRLSCTFVNAARGLANARARVLNSHRRSRPASARRRQRRPPDPSPMAAIGAA